MTVFLLVLLLFPLFFFKIPFGCTWFVGGLLVESYLECVWLVVLVLRVLVVGRGLLLLSVDVEYLRLLVLLWLRMSYLSFSCLLRLYLRPRLGSLSLSLFLLVRRSRFRCSRSFSSFRSGSQ